jgi:transcriptional regulator with XRE-family HTH domain
MTEPQFHGRWRSFSVSNAVDTLGAALRTIKDEDNLSWKEVGRILGKSDDRASDYASGLSEMPVGAFLLACREWNGRFANAALALIGQKIAPLNSDDIEDTDKLCRLLRLAHLISAAIADSKSPGVIDDEELEGFSTADLDDAERAIAALRARKDALAGNVVKLGASQ